jgi:hypothetical protein
MEAIREVGAFAGLAAFLGLAVLALLYFAQARDVRRLRENAEFLVEGEPGIGEAGEPPTAVSTSPEPEKAARAAAASAPTEAEGFRRAELARQAAERRQRFEQRRGPRRGGGMPELPSAAVIVVGALILLAGIGFGATRLLGGDDESGGGAANKGEGLACPPGQTKVAVLNGTAEEGLAGQSASQLKQKGYDVGPVTNTESGFEASVIMFDQGGQPCVAEIAPLVGVQTTEPISEEVRTVSEGAAVSVILGEDRATGGSSGDTGADEGTATDDSAVSEDSGI